MEKKYITTYFLFIFICSSVNASCPHEPVPNDKHYYRLKATKTIILPCPRGTEFSEEICTCTWSKGTSSHTNRLLSGDRPGTERPSGIIPDRPTAQQNPLHPRGQRMSSSYNRHRGRQQYGSPIHGSPIHARINTHTSGTYNPSPYDQRQSVSTSSRGTGTSSVGLTSDQGSSFSFVDTLPKIPRNPVPDRSYSARRKMLLSGYGPSGIPPPPPPPPPPPSIEHRQYVDKDILPPSTIDQFRLNPTHVSQTKQKRPSKQTLDMLKSWFIGGQTSSDTQYVDKHLTDSNLNTRIDPNTVDQQGGLSNIIPPNTDHLFTGLDNTGTLQPNTDDILMVPGETPGSLPKNTGNLVNVPDQSGSVPTNTDHLFIGTDNTGTLPSNTDNILMVPTDNVLMVPGKTPGSLPKNTDNLFNLPDQTGNVPTNTGQIANPPDTGDIVSQIDSLFSLSDFGIQTGNSHQLGSDFNSKNTIQKGNTDHRLNVPSNTDNVPGNTDHLFNVPDNRGNVPRNSGNVHRNTDSVLKNTGHVFNPADNTGDIVSQIDNLFPLSHFGIQTDDSNTLGSNSNSQNINQHRNGDQRLTIPVPKKTDQVLNVPDNIGSIPKNTDHILNPADNTGDIVSRIDSLFPLSDFGIQTDSSNTLGSNSNAQNVNFQGDIVQPPNVPDNTGNVPKNTVVNVPDNINTVSKNKDHTANPPDTGDIVSRIDNLFSISDFGLQTGTSHNIGSNSNAQISNKQGEIRGQANTDFSFNPDTFVPIDNGVGFDPSTIQQGISVGISSDNGNTSGFIDFNPSGDLGGRSGDLNNIFSVGASGSVSGNLDLNSNSQQDPLTSNVNTGNLGNPEQFTDNFVFNEINSISNGGLGSDNQGAQTSSVTDGSKSANQHDKLPNNPNDLFSLPPLGNDVSFSLNDIVPGVDTSPVSPQKENPSSLGGNQIDGNLGTLPHDDVFIPGPVDNLVPLDALGADAGIVNPNEFVPLDAGSTNNQNDNNETSLLTDSNLDPLTGFEDPLAGISEVELLNLLDGMDLNAFLQTNGVPLDQINPVAMKVFQRRIDQAKAPTSKTIGLVKLKRSGAKVSATPVTGSASSTETVISSSSSKLQQKLQRQQERKAAKEAKRLARKQAKAALLAQAKARRKAQRETRIVKRKQQQAARRLAREKARSERIALRKAQLQERQEQRRRQQELRAKRNL